jgi:uncharacterized protein with PIN domain
MKFLIDAMLGKLARFLRIFGYDTVYANDLIEFFKLDPVPDEKLKDYAYENNRIVITKDNQFFQELGDSAVLLEGRGIYNYLNQLKSKFQLNYDINMEKGRCSLCNYELFKVANKQSIILLIPPETYKHYSDFYQCSNPKCKKIFWEGSHIKDIIQKIKNRNQYE